MVAESVASSVTKSKVFLPPHRMRRSRIVLGARAFLFAIEVCAVAPRDSLVGWMIEKRDRRALRTFLFLYSENWK
jgi:hypothetical protein